MAGDFDFINLTPEVRKSMLAEIDQDIAVGPLVFSKRFNDVGTAQYPALLREAVTTHDEAWLGNQLQAIGAFVKVEVAAGKERAVREDAHVLLSQNEFNRFYFRGLCAHAISSGQGHVRVYRARHSANPRPESEAKVNLLLDPRVVLGDLRSHLATEPEFGMPQIFSGLSLELTAHADSL